MTFSPHSDVTAQRYGPHYPSIGLLLILILVTGMWTSRDAWEEVVSCGSGSCF
jgi:hypothetical protein